MLTAPFHRTGTPLYPDLSLSDDLANVLIATAETHPVVQARIDALVRLYRAGIEPPRREEYRVRVVSEPLFAALSA